VKRWLIALIPAVLIVILLGYVLGSHVVPQSVQDNLANAATPPDISGLPDDNVAGALPEAPANVPAAAAPANTTAPVVANDVTTPDANDDSSGSQDDADAQAQARREISAAVRRATIAALDSGEPAHWHKDGLAGDIVVSEPQDDGQDGTCRTVTATIGNDDDQKQSGNHIWCQPSDGGDWAPQ